MDWKAFIASLIDSLAWPAVVAYLTFVMKDKIGELLPKLRRFKHKDTELEFSQGVEELKREAEETPEPISPELSESGDLGKQFDFLVQLAEVSPRSAVLEAWRQVENAAAKAIVRSYPQLGERDVLSPMDRRNLLKGKVLHDSEWRQYDELRKLRNKAAHSDEFDLRGTPIEAYIDIAVSMARRLDAYEP